MEILEALLKRKAHADRLSNTSGSEGESFAISQNSTWIERPKGQLLDNLLSELKRTGIDIKRTSFDAIELPKGATLDFCSVESIKAHLPQMNFIEIKTTSKSSVKDDFSGYFFAFTEGELSAAEQLQSRHKVALINKVTGTVFMSTVPELLKRAKSMNWQVSVQL
ncbi:hypothetical protein KW539_10740 [Vibrio fluvialis]|nr:hypothetical protein [Vibrio fluvialis]MBY8240488.1 hypothetical protein [Vibrio fluvialis]